MAKRGVFGMKEMPLDPVRMEKSKPKKRDPEVRIRKAGGGYIISCSPDTEDEYKEKEVVKESLEGALEAARDHLEGKKEKKD